MTIDNLHQLRLWTPPYRPDALIEDNLLFPGAVMMVFGAAGSWKTMTSNHLACCLARGEPWFGYETKSATVFSHQAELPKFQARERILKYIDNNRKESNNLFFFTPEDNTFLDTTIGASLLLKQIEEVQRRAHDPSLPVVVILDPLKHYMQGHISDEYDVSKFQRNIDPIRKKQNVAFIIIHHARLTRVDGSGQVVDLGAEELMGSSYWNNWLDTIVRLQVTNPFSGNDTVHMTFGKHRNAQKFHPGWTVRWNRDTITPEILGRDIIPEDEPSIRDLT